MLNEKQIQSILSKLRRFEKTVEPLMFEKADDVPMAMYITGERLDSAPGGAYFTPAEKGARWGGEWHYGWFRGQYTPAPGYAGQPLYVRARTGGVESLLFVDGLPFGIFNWKPNMPNRAGHHTDLLTQSAAPGKPLKITLEAYAGHYTHGSMPTDTPPRGDFMHTYEGVEIYTKNDAMADFYFDLKTFNQLAQVLGENNFVRAHIVNALTRLHGLLYYSPEDVEPELFTQGIRQASAILKELYQYKNSSLAPTAAVIGHSHMDTAWHWPMEETIKKCARTYSSQISLMRRYPEYKFIQSSAYHLKMMLDHYPALFAEIKKMVAEGRYEPNGGVWIECDCNITGGEMMIRQFLWGQRFTQAHFGYTSNCFWLPDTFGYSASVPQIMKGCGVDYFLTTKVSWNDTNTFPYHTFWWEGIDGTRVLSHLNRTHCWPDPETCVNSITSSGHEGLKEKTVAPTRLLAYGHGDGGGGPQFEMIEMARRAADIDGCPKVETMLVGEFMQRLEETAVMPSVHSGELYLERHRGTLTSLHTIKRNNRLAEIGLRNAEYRTVRAAAEQNAPCEAGPIKPLVETLLINQFHDILPGTSHPVVHDRSIRETTEVIARANEITQALSPAQEADPGCISIINTLPQPRRDTIYLNYPGALLDAEGAVQQVFTDINGNKRLAVSGLTLAPFSARPFRLAQPAADKSVFHFDGTVLDAPLYRVSLDERRYITQLYDKTAGREIRGKGYALNTFIMAEDLPEAWDNWDIDADIEFKYKDEAVLLESAVVSDGAAEFRLRNRYRLTDRTTLTQDIIFSTARKQITFETQIDWNERHRLLKTAFDTTIHASFARQEIQYGYLCRSTARSTDLEKARFEVCNHKYTSLSETNYGVAMLNDCKYGISCLGGQLRLTLHKGGCHPDNRGDQGVHRFTYSLIFHENGFSAQNVILPAYELNIPPITLSGKLNETAFLQTDRPNIMAEAVKPCEDAQKAYIIRLYEAEGTYTHAKLTFGHAVTKCELTDMLEQPLADAEWTGNEALLSFQPFEIKTLRVGY